jgi:Fe-S-cluster containining protein
MRDDLVRRTVKRVARWHFGVNLYVIRAWRRARGERPHVLGGGCRRSGGCCESPTITVGRLLWSLAPAQQLFLAWQRHVNGFELTRREPEARALVFGCTHFDRETRSCDSYDSRPGMCRDYPRLLLWQPNPELLPGCGFRAIASNAEGLREALDRLDLTPEQREKLRKGLRLDAD